MAILLVAWRINALSIYSASMPVPLSAICSWAMPPRAAERVIWVARHRWHFPAVLWPHWPVVLQLHRPRSVRRYACPAHEFPPWVSPAFILYLKRFSVRTGSSALPAGSAFQYPRCGACPPPSWARWGCCRLLRSQSPAASCCCGRGRWPPTGAARRGRAWSRCPAGPPVWRPQCRSCHPPGRR